MNITYKEIEYKNFGTCLEISNGFLELIVTIDQGPRIISFRRLNGENVFFEDINSLQQTAHPDMDKMFGKGAVWNGLGGHRLWRAPESYSTYYPEEAKVEYLVEDNTFTFIQEVQRYNLVQLSFQLRFIDHENVEFIGKVVNKSEEQKTLSAWSLSMCKGPGLLVVELPKDETAFSPRTQYSFWGFGAKINDKRAFYGNDFFALRMEPGNMDAFKVGLRVNPAKVLYLTDHDAFITTFERDDTQPYPDNNVNFETYTRDLFLEIETLSPLKKVRKNESQSIKEIWTLKELNDEIPNVTDDCKMNKLFNKYVK